MGTVSGHAFLFLVKERTPPPPVQSAALPLCAAAAQIYKSRRSSALVWHKTSRAGHVIQKI